MTIVRPKRKLAEKYSETEGLLASSVTGSRSQVFEKGDVILENSQCHRSRLTTCSFLFPMHRPGTRGLCLC